MDGATCHALTAKMMNAKTPAAARGCAGTSADRRLESAGAASKRPTAHHTSHLIAPDHTRIAAGNGIGSHGTITSASSQVGASEAPARAAAMTAAAAAAAKNSEGNDNGSSTMRGPSGVATASVASDSHAAATAS